MRQQRIDQRPRRAARRGVNHHACGLVDHDQIRVFKHDLQRDFLGEDMTVFGLFHIDGDLLPRFGATARIGYHCPVDTHGPLFQQTPQPCARQVRILWHIARKRLIKARWRAVRDGKRNLTVRHD